MRPGLVVIGLALMFLAGGGVAALFLIPIPTSTTTSTSSTTWTASPGATNSTEILGPASLAGTLVIRWQSTLPLTVSIYASNGCDPRTPGCPGWQLASSGTDVGSGNWTVSGTVRFPYLFSWSNPGTKSGPIALTTLTTQPGSASLSPISELLLGLGVGVLGFGGAVVLFLGLFLRGGVYGRPPAPTSRHPEDVAEKATSPARPEGPPPRH